MPTGAIIPVILLAAGGSKRLGHPKQLLQYRGRTLLRHALDIALTSHAARVTVVIGAYPDRMRAELTGLPVHIVENADWESGMGRSIRAGLAATLAAGPTDGVLIMVCDQPAVSPPLLDSLIDRHAQTAAPIIACSYGGTLGVPALFDRCTFAELAQLPDAAGARSLIQRYTSRVIEVPFPEGEWDVDTPDDQLRLNAENANQ
jgi:molybdenum cofactor cytidylyltransferase